MGCGGVGEAGPDQNHSLGGPGWEAPAPRNSPSPRGVSVQQASLAPGLSAAGIDWPGDPQGTTAGTQQHCCARLHLPPGEAPTPQLPLFPNLPLNQPQDPQPPGQSGRSQRPRMAPAPRLTEDTTSQSPPYPALPSSHVSLRGTFSVSQVTPDASSQTSSGGGQSSAGTLGLGSEMSRLF